MSRHCRSAALALAALMLVIPRTIVAQQATPGSDFALLAGGGLGGGLSDVGGYSGGVSGTAGAELRFARVFAVRTDATALGFLAGASAIPECIPSAPCITRRTVGFGAIGAVAAVVQPFAFPVYVMGGIERIYAPNTESPGPSAASGVNVGGGIGFDRNRRRAIEARYYVPRRDLGLTSALVQVSLLWRFTAPPQGATRRP
jgi:hypothetical protein